MNQLLLGLPTRDVRNRDAYVVSASNATAVSAIDSWQTWPDGRMALIGPEKSGKSHLAYVWAEAVDARIVDISEIAESHVPALARSASILLEDLDRATLTAECEEAILHLVNLLREFGHSLLLTACTPPSAWPISLPDLASRLRSVWVCRIDKPDDTLLSALLTKRFADFQLEVDAKVIAFLVSRMERSGAEVERVAAALDAEAMRSGRAVTQPFARSVLGW